MGMRRRVLGMTVLLLSLSTVTGLPAGAQESAPAAPAAAPAGCPEPKPVPIPDVAYGSHPRHTLDIYPAPGRVAAPIVITVHGGGWVRGDNSGKRITCVTQRFHELGYAVFSINYRQATPQQDGVPMQTNDITQAVRWVAANGARYGGDVRNINLLGGSSGAQLVALAGQLMNRQQPGLLRGVVEMSGVMDFVAFFQPGQTAPGDEQHEGASTYLGCTPSTCTDQELKQASPRYQIRAGTCPDYLLIHGKTEVLPVTQATEMHKALLNAGCESTIKVPNTSQHGLALLGFTEADIVAFLNNP